MDWHSRKVLSWKMSNTHEADNFVAALREALARNGAHGIFNTVQRAQFISLEFTEILKEAGVRISMDNKGRWMDNIMIEQLWQSPDYDYFYLHAFETGFELEITAIVARQKCRIYEVGISYSGRTYEEGKKINWKDGISALRCIFKYNLFW